ncbi:MAG: hypothetical protein R6W78_06510 [Bacteroidales bacterium]
MANIRKLKKEIKYLAADLIDECKSYFAFHPDSDPKKRDELTANIMQKKKEIIHEINHLKKTAPEKAKAYVNMVLEKVKKEMIPVLDEISKVSDK